MKESCSWEGEDAGMGGGGMKQVWKKSEQMKEESNYKGSMEQVAPH